MDSWERRVKQIKAGFFQTAEDAQRYHRNIYENQGIIRVKNVIEVEHVVNHAVGSVVDVGTGTGRFAIPMHDAGCKVTGVDVAEPMLEVARKAAGGRSIDWVLGDVEALPFDDKSFDTVASLNVIIHLPQWREAVREFQRVVKDDGRIIFDMYSGDHVEIANRHGIKYGTRAQNNHDAAFFSEVRVAEMCSFIESCGMTVDAIIPHDLLNSNHLIQDRLGAGFEDYCKYIKSELITNDDAFNFWLFVERNIIPRLPTEATLEYIVVAINGQGGRNQVPKPLSSYSRPFAAQGFLRELLAQDYERIRSIATDLLSQGSVRFMHELSRRLFRHLDPNINLSSLFPEQAEMINKLASPFAFANQYFGFLTNLFSRP